MSITGLFDKLNHSISVRNELKDLYSHSIDEIVEGLKGNLVGRFDTGGVIPDFYVMVWDVLSSRGAINIKLSYVYIDGQNYDGKFYMTPIECLKMSQPKFMNADTFIFTLIDNEAKYSKTIQSSPDIFIQHEKTFSMKDFFENGLLFQDEITPNFLDQNHFSFPINRRAYSDSYQFLVADDEKLYRDHVVELLREMGYTRIHEAYSGEHALDILGKKPNAEANGRFHLLFTDWKLGRPDGIEVIRNIRSGTVGDGYKNLPAVLISRNGSQDNINEAKGLATMYIVKPVTQERELFQKIVPYLITQNYLT